MKRTTPLLLLLALVALSPLVSRGEPSAATQPGARQAVAVPAGANAAADTIDHREFANNIVKVFMDCQKIKAGMTRAELVKLEMFDQDWGPLSPADDKAFREHATFYYRRCGLIKVDVDFAATEAKESQPADRITKVSMPYIDARPRR